MSDNQDRGANPQPPAIDEAVRTLTWAYELVPTIALSGAPDTAGVFDPTLHASGELGTIGGLVSGPGVADAQAAIAKAIDALTAAGGAPLLAADSATVLSTSDAPGTPGSETLQAAIAGTIDVLVTIGDQAPDQEARDAIDRTIDVLVAVGDTPFGLPGFDLFSLSALAADTAAVFMPPVDLSHIDLPPVDLPPIITEDPSVGPAAGDHRSSPVSTRTGVVVVVLLVVVLGGALLLLFTRDGDEGADSAAVAGTDLTAPTTTSAPTTSEAPTTTSAAPNRPPTVTELRSSLAVPVTTYTAAATDPDGDTLTYEWSMAGEPCGIPLVPWTASGQSVSWSHHEDEGCSHESVDHGVTLSLTVSDGRGGSVQCVINGSATASYDVNEACLS